MTSMSTSPFAATNATVNISRSLIVYLIRFYCADGAPRQTFVQGSLVIHG